MTRFLPTIICISLIQLIILPVAAENYVPTLRSCSPEESSEVLRSVRTAQVVADMVYESASMLVSPAAEEQYGMWFQKVNEPQEIDDSIFETVKETYSKIRSTLMDGPFEINCKGGYCSHKTGYVHRSGGKQSMNLCPAFFRAPREVQYCDALKKCLTQPGTFINLASRMDSGGSAIDYIESPFGSTGLAKTSPKKAVRNALNYEYFAMNLAHSSSNSSLLAASQEEPEVPSNVRFNRAANPVPPAPQ